MNSPDPMFAITFPSGMWLGLGIYVLLLAITVVHVVRSHRSRWEKTIAVLGVVLIPVGGMLDWWWGVGWSSRAHQVARRHRSRNVFLVDRPEKEQ